MSPKELQYVEDALNHEKHLKTKCTDYANLLQDAELKDFVTQLANRHSQIYSTLYQVL